MTCARCATGERAIGELDFEEPFAFEEEWEPEIIGPQDTRVLIKKTTDAPFRYICNLEYDYPGTGRRAMCTGTLIGPRTVLTAGHCLAKRDPKRMRVIPGRHGTLEPLPATQAVSPFVLAPGYSETTPTDYGIIHLADPIGTKVGYWTLETHRNPGDSVGTSILSTQSLPLPAGTLKVNLSGYPADKPSDKKYFCRDPKQPLNRCRHSLIGDKRSALCGTYQYRTYDLTLRLKDGILQHLNDACPGHSGSPVWVKRSPDMGGRVMVGILVAGAGIANRTVFINKAVRSFIAANIK